MTNTVATKMESMNEIEHGLDLHRSGDLVGAKKIYMGILEKDPDNVDANNLISDIYIKNKDPRSALYHINKAIALNRNSIFLNSRGMVFIELGKYNDAINDLRAAIKLDHTSYHAHNNLSIAYRQAGDLKKSLVHAEEATSLNKEFAEGWLSLGAVRQAIRDFQGAYEAYILALKINSGSAIAMANVAKVLYQMNRFDESFSYFEELYSRGWRDLETSFVYAQILIDRGEIKSAAELIKSSFDDNSLKQLKPILEQDVFFGVLYKVCTYYIEAVGQSEIAVKLYVKAGEEVPSLKGIVHNNIASAYFVNHDIENAINHINIAIEHNSGESHKLSMGYNNLGVFYMSKGESDKAIQAFKKSISIEPHNLIALGWLLKEKLQICDFSDIGKLRDSIDGFRFRDNSVSISPFTPLSVYDDPEALLYWAKLASRDLFGQFLGMKKEFQKDSIPQKNRSKIRIGYYSYDFRNHPVAYLTARLFEVHNKDRFEIYAYSYGPDDGSVVRNRIINGVDNFVDMRDMTILESAERLIKDDIDILIDLTGNTQHNRSQVFAFHPARITAHWLGFVGTMGSNNYDYIIADNIVVPLGDEPFYAEKIIRLPSGFHISDNTRKSPIALYSKEHYGLKGSAFVFASFCQSVKIQPEQFYLWLEILNKVPGSVLWLAKSSEQSSQNLLAEASRSGFDSSRIVFCDRCDMDEYLGRFSHIDLHLDTFPYTSGTVASDCLLSDCLHLTLTGRTMVSRMAGSILKNAGFPELVAASPSEFINTAVKFAQDGTFRKTLKDRLLLKRNTSCLLDTKKSCEELEACIESLLA